MSAQEFQSPHSLMVQGTTSDAGKTVLVAAICRILKNHGVSVAPFKPQNMALNSAVTPSGGEIGRAQAVQAEACGIEPSVLMNPILLKPNSDTGAQVIVMGKAVGNFEAVAYHNEKPKLLATVIAAHAQLQQQYSTVIIEGAGSPAEINLREHDLANMGFAEAADCPVVIVADIDRGGVFAHLLGTYQLLSTTEQARIKGFVINRFRGDVSLLQSGLDWLEEKTAVPVLGVIPYIKDLHIESEDSVQQNQTTRGAKLHIAIIGYPRMSNHTDFDALRLHPHIDCTYYRDPKKVQQADIIILPGTKHVRADLQWLKENGWQAKIQQHLRYGGKVLGICGGYQMLGGLVSDPDGVESAAGDTEGLGLLNIRTVLTEQKALYRVEGQLLDAALSLGFSPAKITGYEIHAGRTTGDDTQRALVSLLDKDTGEEKQDGAISEDSCVAGTYVHGFFDEPSLVNSLFQWFGVALDADETFDYKALRDSEMDRLASEVERALGLNTLLSLVNLPSR
ncbi:MAG: cobyric acid synthase [Sinobacterium sp.]|nr:cobyric acid synthase [Sinobacterium sp.]